MFSPGDVAGLVLVYAYVSLVVSLAAWARKRNPTCDYRKLIHILVGNIVFLWWVFDDRWTMGLLAALPFVFLLLMATPEFPLKRLTGSFLDEATEQGHGYGLVYYAVSWTLLALFLFDDRMVAGIAIAAMSFGDGLGGLLGKKYGRKKLYRKKTYVGTFGVFLGTATAALAVMAFYTFLSGYLPQLGVPELTPMFALGAAALAGAFVAMVELFSPGEYDNLIVPLSTAALMLLIGL
jgi:phytol kinase